MTTELQTLTYTVDDGVAVIRLNRPERMNAIGATMKDDLEEAFFSLARNDDSVRCVVITGAGDRAFCAGADIKERADAPPTKGTRFYTRQQDTHALFRRIEEFEHPVIAAINGVAAGGGLEIALVCDIRIAAAHARLGLPEVKLGVLPSAGGTQRLPRLIGESKAKELMFLGELIDAEQARTIGLVNRVVDADALFDNAMTMARNIAGKPPLAVRFIKRAVNTGTQVGLDSGMQFERFAAAMIVDSDDRKEGMRAFVEKRPPIFKGE